MSGLYLCTVAVHAEQYQTGMDSILGRPILVVQAQITFAPHTLKCVVTPGDWVVENGDRVINLSGTAVKQGKAVVVLSDAEFRKQYRPLMPRTIPDAVD